MQSVALGPQHQSFLIAWSFVISRHLQCLQTLWRAGADPYEFELSDPVSGTLN
jgi:hypothetical protein